MPLLDVFDQVPLLRKFHTTRRTTVRLILGMHVHMPIQVALGPEPFATNVTFMSLLARVREYVSIELSSPSELAGTVWTRIGETIRVHFRMHPKRRGCLEGFATRMAHKRTFAGMRASMIVAYTSLGKSTATQIAQPVPPVLMHIAQMPQKRRTLHHFLAANMANKTSCSMRVHMQGHPLPRCQFFTTLVANHLRMLLAHSLLPKFFHSSINAASLI